MKSTRQKSDSSPRKPASPAGSRAASRSLAASTRLRILRYLQEHHTTTTVELAQAWGLTRADIRYHLNLLLREQLIEQLPPEPDPLAGPGRPVIRYHLAQTASANPVHDLCSIVFAMLLKSASPEDRSKILQDIANQITTRHRSPAAPDSPPASNLTQRLNQAVLILNQAHYLSRWEARAQGPRIVFRSCPYATILAHAPELCQLDQLILENLLHHPVQQISRINLETGQPSACVFELETRLKTEC